MREVYDMVGNGREMVHQKTKNKQELVYDVLRRNLATPDLHKKNRGEVFTAMTIVEDQLSHLPVHLWKDKTLKWLDVASGMGTYAIHCYYALMQGLSGHIRNHGQRSKHIIEKMLYMVEIDADNVRKCRELFRIVDPMAMPNVVHTDFLDPHLNLKTGAPTKNSMDLFDVVVGNPPYTKPNNKDKGRLSTRSLYPAIVAKALSLLKPGGYMSFIHPVSWRRYSRESRFSFDTSDILFMYTNNGFNGFGVSAPYVNYYIIRNTNTPRLKTDCVTVLNGHIYRSWVNLKNHPFLPLHLHNRTMRIIYKLTNHRHNHSPPPKKSLPVDIKIISSNSTSKLSINSTKSSVFRYKNIHNYSVKKDRYIYRYSRRKHRSHDVPKVVMIYKGGFKYFKPIFDRGTLGITDNAMFMPVDEKHKDQVLAFFNSNIIKFILCTCNYNYGRNMKNEYLILNRLHIPIRKGGKVSGGEYEQFIRTHYGLTGTDIQFINKVLGEHDMV
jgi:hypothetical protein